LIIVPTREPRRCLGREEQMIRLAKKSDAEAVAKIYNYYIKETVVTFELEPVSAELMEARVEKGLADMRWFVFEEDGKVVGYAYAAKWRERAAYKDTVETSVYLDKGATGRGIGAMLQKYLMQVCKLQGVHVMIAGIALPNEASVKMHEKLGFKKVAHFEEVGIKFGRKIDVGYWQYTVE
jgi:L-amino acid N-acyltransferase YncA